MPGTVRGGKKAGKANKRLYGRDYYVRIGAAGGRAGHTGGFYVRRDLASAAGRLGGLRSRKGHVQTWRVVNDKKIAAAYAHLLKVQEKAKQEREKQV